jgi:hypothetical protein
VSRAIYDCGVIEKRLDSKCRLKAEYLTTTVPGDELTDRQGNNKQEIHRQTTTTGKDYYIRLQADI